MKKLKQIYLKKLKQMAKKQTKQAENIEQQYIDLYKHITGLLTLKNYNPTLFKRQDELDSLIEKSKEYEGGVKGAKNCTLGIKGLKIVISTEVCLPKTYVDIILSNDKLNHSDYLAL